MSLGGAVVLKKLILGSGKSRFPGFINVDSSAEVEPDLVLDLEKTPWPCEDDSTEHIVLYQTWVPSRATRRLAYVCEL